MSECVVRMEMPRNCFECPFSVMPPRDHEHIWCNALPNEVVADINKRDADCPIICELPEKRGRLVDADMLKQKWLYRGNDGKPYRDEIDSMPTIVPAERSET